MRSPQLYSPFLLSSSPKYPISKEAQPVIEERPAIGISFKLEGQKVEATDTEW